MHTLLCYIGTILLFFGHIEKSWASSPSSPLELPTHSRSQATTLQEEEKKFEIVREEVVYSRWRSIISRVVRMPNGNEVDFDIVDQKGVGAAIVFAWDSNSKTATIVKEYNPGPNKVLCGLAAGIVESGKHNADFDEAARQELEEECHLSGGNWYRLFNPGASMAMDKYVVTEIVAYLVINPTKVANPPPLDAEEDIEILEGVSIDDIMGMIQNGEMNCIGALSSLLAIEKLRELSEIE